MDLNSCGLAWFHMRPYRPSSNPFRNITMSIIYSLAHVQGKRADARLNILALHPYKYAAPGSCSQIDQAGIGFT